MIRPVRPDGRVDAGGAFTPIYRPRVVDRIATAAQQRVVLLVAPAGYGKSTAMRQYLERLDEPYARYDLHADNATLLGFIRGFADAISNIAPDARNTVSSAYASARRSISPVEDLAMWMHAHLKSYTGSIVIDDLHIAEEDADVPAFLAALIERTRGRTRWLIASRSYLDLPIGTWMAYAEMDLAVDETDLRFTPEEAREAARASRVGVRDEELRDLLELTDGWPTALSFALRSSTRSLDLRNVQATTREMIYRYLAEQVYRSLNDDEREILALAILLPEIDIRVLQAAGYENALYRIEELRDRVAFLVPDRERDGIYLCHDLFRDFVRHQIALEGSDATAKAYAASGRALELSGDTPGSLFLYAQARDATSILRLLDAHGFALYEEGHADAIAAALQALDTRSRAEEPMALALRGLTEASAGRYDHAVSLLKRAAKRARNAEMRSQALLCAARVAINSGGPDPRAMLEEVEETPDDISTDTRGEAASMLAVYLARRGERNDATEAVERALMALDVADIPQVQARIMQRIGLALFEIGALKEARGYFSRSADLSSQYGLISLASLAYGGLCRIANMAGDAPTEAHWYAQQGLAMATRSGDSFGLFTALGHLLGAETRRGNAERVAAIEKQMMAIRTTDASLMIYVHIARAWRAAWEGNFAEAHRLVSTSWQKVSGSWLRMQTAAAFAVWAAAAEKPEAAEEAIAAALQVADNEREVANLGDMPRLAPILLCAFAEGLGGRMTVAQKLLKRVSTTDDPKVIALRDAVREGLQALRGSRGLGEEAGPALDRLRGLGHGGFASLIESTLRAIEGRRNSQNSDTSLTPSEVAVLRLLADGSTPKEIAAETGRSVYTVQAHIQNAIEKLQCHGRHEAIAVARERGLLRA